MTRPVSTPDSRPALRCLRLGAITSGDQHTRRRSGGRSPVRVVDEATGELIHLETDETSAAQALCRPRFATGPIGDTDTGGVP